MTLPQAFLDAPIAHRALHGPGRPENSRAAVAAAMENGYGIEIDLQLSSDGVAMVFHDDDLDRLTDAEGPLRGRSAAELAAIHLSGGGDGIPRFADVLSLVAGRVPLLVELKDQTGELGAGDTALAVAAARAVRGYDGPLAFMSFNPHAVAAVAEHAPEVPRGLVTTVFTSSHWPRLSASRAAELTAIGDLERVGAAFISHAHSLLDMPRVAEIRAMGLPILCWTIRSQAEADRARGLADQITFEGFTPQPAPGGTARDPTS